MQEPWFYQGFQGSCGVFVEWKIRHRRSCVHYNSPVPIIGAGYMIFEGSPKTGYLFYVPEFTVKIQLMLFS